MGGRVAEELIFGDDYITTGASVISMVATKIAKMMVTRFAMSDKLGVMTYGDVTKQSPETQAAIEQEVRVLLKDSITCKKHPETYSKEPKKLADALLRYETLDARDPDGDCEMALCGGVNCIIEPRVFVALSKAKMISPEGTSKPFSKRADGYGRGEGCGVVLLKPLKNAVKDCNKIWGVISKTAVNQDGRSVTPITKPSMAQQEELLRRIYSESDLADVQYIEAHGTGTPVGDPVEAGSILNVIGKARSPCSGTLLIGSVKDAVKVLYHRSTLQSKVTDWCSDGDFHTGRYWTKNIREPVLFEKTLRVATGGEQSGRNVVFVEIGPRKALQRNIHETLGNDTIVLPSVQPEKDYESVLSTLGKLFELGINVDWHHLYKGYETLPTALPVYQFDLSKKQLNFEEVRQEGKVLVELKGVTLDGGLVDQSATERRQEELENGEERRQGNGSDSGQTLVGSDDTTTGGGTSGAQERRAGPQAREREKEWEDALWNTGEVEYSTRPPSTTATATAAATPL
ncbi:hypothetical protein INR49_021639 [Caranx melampygus]|nr:hypothetical protein INR49_021639 [Caranx melampygus]